MHRGLRQLHHVLGIKSRVGMTNKPESRDFCTTLKKMTYWWCPLYTFVVIFRGGVVIIFRIPLR